MIEIGMDDGLQVLICACDKGTGDNFYKQGQLLPENFAAAAKESGNDNNLTLRYQEVCLFSHPMLVEERRLISLFRIMITHTSSSRHLEEITLDMPLNTYSHSMFSIFIILCSISESE